MILCMVLEILVLECFFYMIKKNYHKRHKKNVRRLNSGDSAGPQEKEIKELIVGDIYEVKKGEWIIGDCLLIDGNDVNIAQWTNARRVIYRKNGVLNFTEEMSKMDIESYLNRRKAQEMEYIEAGSPRIASLGVNDGFFRISYQDLPGMGTEGS
jgi:hypothetical protein